MDDKALVTKMLEWVITDWGKGPDAVLNHFWWSHGAEDAVTMICDFAMSKGLDWDEIYWIGCDMFESQYPELSHLTTHEAALLMGRSPQLVRRLCLQGRLPGAYKAGRDWLIPENSVIEFAKVKRPVGRPRDEPRKGISDENVS